MQTFMYNQASSHNLSFLHDKVQHTTQVSLTLSPCALHEGSYCQKQSHICYEIAKNGGGIN